MKRKRELITKPRLGKRLGVTSDTIREWIKRGYMPEATHQLFEGSKLMGYTQDEVDAIVLKIKGKRS